MKKIKSISLFIFLSLFLINTFAQNIVINEIMSSNSSAIADEDGDYSDWLELYNTSTTTVNLENFGISDDTNDPFKWQFPAINLESHQHLIIFASDKDRKKINNTIITRGDLWKYKIWSNQPPYSWNTINYNDSQWETGATGIGYGDGDDATVIPENTISLYARKSFIIDNIDDIESAILTIDYDDGFVAYINGVEIARKNIEGSPPAYNSLANPDHEALLYQGKYPENFEISNVQNILVTGENVLAIQMHNTNEYSSDFSFIPYLTLGLKSNSDNIFTPEELQFNSASLHTNFKISASGETLTLTNSDGEIIDQVQAGAIPTDISWGRKPDGSDDWVFFNNFTPGESNSSEGYNDISPIVIFDKAAGFYSGTITLSMYLEEDNFPIYYTLDNSEPTINSLLYSSPISINKTTIVRAKTIKENSLPGRITTQSYFFNSHHDLPVISLSTNPPNLFDPDSGIYVLGRNYEQALPYFGANFWQDWEKPVHIELFEPDGNLGFSANAGMKIFGGWSRANNQKSLAFYARSKYGDSQFNYQIFPDRDIKTFEAFVLRNSANDFPFTMLRDGFLQSLIQGSNIDDQGYRPAVIYINGEYWGIQNIREKLNEHYVASHHNVDPDNIDLLESNGIANNGDADEWWHIYNFISNNNLHFPSNYEYVKSKIDMANFLDYYISEIYFDNTDWPGNNIKYWKEKSAAGKWRWILYDTDFAFALYGNVERYKYNTLEFATASNGPDWPNPPWSTLFLRKFLQNDEFKNDFINCFCDNLNTRFSADKIKEKLQIAKERIENEIPFHIQRWNGIGSMDNWYNQIEKLKTFGINRFAYSFIHLNSFFDLTGVSSLLLEIDPPNSGKIKLNTVTIEDENFQGSYFKGIPIKIEAIPNPGYKFSNWSGDLESTNMKPEEILLDGTTKITCNFELGTPDDENILINEINYKSADEFDTGDWVELVNNSEFSMPIEGWIFKDSNNDHNFEIPANFILEPNSFLVLVEDMDSFKEFHPTVNNVLGNFDFGLSKDGEDLRLFNAAGELIDVVSYMSKSPWPSEPDGEGATLILKDPNLDNSLAENWEASKIYGSPGQPNFETSINENSETVIHDFILNQNYPNPFNNSTVISFALPKAGIIKLSVYNLAGELVKIIENSHYSIGAYKIQFNTDSNMPSGIYFYSLAVDGKILSINKMVYLK